MPETVVPIVFAGPEGAELTLRATLGARKRIAERFGSPDIKAILVKYGDGALPEIAHSLMFDKKGKPPAITAEELAESLTPEDAVTLLSHVLAAFSQGKISPNEAEALLTKLAELEESSPGTMSTGSASGPSAGSVSDSVTAISGTDSSSAKSTLSPGLTATENSSGQDS